VYPEFPAQTVPTAVEPLSEYALAGKIMGVVLTLARPYDDEIRVCVRGDRRGILLIIAEKAHTHTEFRAQRVPAVVVPLSKDPAAVTLTGAGPDDDKVADRIRGNGWIPLILRRVRVYLELWTHGLGRGN